MNTSIGVLGIILLSQAFLCADELKNEIASSNEIASLYHRESKKAQSTQKSYAQEARGEKGIFVYAEYLLWEAQQDGLQYTGTEHIVLNSTGSFINLKNNVLSEKIKIKDVHSEYNSGVRVGLGYLLSKKKDSWDVLVDWTGYQGNAHGETESDITTTDFLIPIWGNQLFLNSGPDSSQFDKATAHWHLNYQTVNFELGRNTFIGRKVSVRPFIGVEWAQINQEFQAKYRAPAADNSNLPGGSSLGPFTTKFTGKNDFSGTGIRFGADAKWYFTRHFGVCAELAGALLWGRFHIREKFFVPEITQTDNGTLPPTVTLSPTFTAKEKQNLNRLSPNLQAAGGLFWKSSFNEGKRSIMIALEYELTAWFFQNYMAPLNTSVSGNTARAASNQGLFFSMTKNSLLSLQGFTGCIKFDF